MSNRIPPIEPIPEYTEIPRYPKKRGKRPAVVLPNVPPASIKASRTGHLSDEMLADHESLMKYLKFWAREIARDLAEKREAVGITASDVRLEGFNRGKWISAQFKGREFSFLSGMFRSMGLVCTERTEMSAIKTARNDNHVWVLPRYAKQQQRAG